MKLKDSFKQMISRLKEKAGVLKKEIAALYLAYRRRDVPWYAKLCAILVVGYALSPVDLVPDFIPILGYLDDLVLIPLGITLAVKLIPENIMAECREQAQKGFLKNKAAGRAAGAVIILLWIAVIAFVLFKIIW